MAAANVVLVAQQIGNYGLTGDVPVLDDCVVAAGDQMELIGNWVLDDTNSAYGLTVLMHYDDYDDVWPSNIFLPLFCPTRL
ncbi:hypothetical protein M0R45_010979 [Rubus argutus]|uniref:Uncharacterized protein n=1 Tax=Rubus argutus TaxID=59490 RepID=A0AAW1YB65_RUBAR